MRKPLTLPPHTAARLAQPETRRDVLLDLAERGLETARRYLAEKVAPLADFDTCRETRYADTAASLEKCVRRHTNKFLDVCIISSHLALSARSLEDVAAAEGVTHPIFGELVMVADQVFETARVLRDAWQRQSVRILSDEEIQEHSFTKMVKVVRDGLAETTTATGTDTEPGTELEDKAWVTIHEAAQALGCAAKTVRQRIKRGEIAADLVDGPRGPEYHIPVSALPTISAVWTQQSSRAATE